jgi:hypothetical protein
LPSPTLRAMLPTAWLRAKPWTVSPLPERVNDYPTMLNVEEKQLLYMFARDYVRDGAIIDAGCFLGGSTVALSSGLAKRPWARSQIHTYDLFTLDSSSAWSYPDLVRGIEVGASTRPRFDELMAGLLERVTVYEGDICETNWSGEAIDLLFVDVAKEWEINDHVTREFFPSLVPGRSILIQQDLVHEWLPWITITMGLFDDAFEFVGVAESSSAVYVCRRAISVNEIPDRLDDLPSEQKLELFDRGASRFVGEHAGVIECARVVLLVNVGRPVEAEELLRDLGQSEHARVQEIVLQMETWLRQTLPAASAPSK